VLVVTQTLKRKRDQQGTTVIHGQSGNNKFLRERQPESVLGRKENRSAYRL